MTGPGFWIVGILTGLDETVLDFFANLSVVFAIFVFFTGLFIGLITFGYLYFSGVPFDISRGAVLAVGIMIEVMPFISILPAGLASLFTIRWMEHQRYKKDFDEWKKKANSVPRVVPSPA